MKKLTVKKSEQVNLNGMPAIRLIFEEKELPNALIFDVNEGLLISGFVYLHEEENYENFFEDYLEPQEIKGLPFKKRGITNDKEILKLTKNFLRKIN